MGVCKLAQIASLINHHVTIYLILQHVTIWQFKKSNRLHIELHIAFVYMTTSPSPFYYSPEELAELLEKRGIDVQTDGFIRCTNTCIIRRLVQRMGL